MSDTLVQLRGVSLSYSPDSPALIKLDLDIQAGEYVCVVGANGSGKSTLASLLAGLVAPDAGDISLAGQQVCADGQADFSAYAIARKQLALVFQNPDDQMVTTVVEDDVAFGPENLGLDPQEIERRVRRELRRVAMSDFAQADPTRLSGGQQQRIALAGALAMEPQLLVLDEPGALLDVRGRRSLMKTVHQLHEAGTTIVHVTHFMDEALEADRVLVMAAGQIVIDGTPQQVFSQYKEIHELGLEEPFVAHLSQRLAQRGLPVQWTCDPEELQHMICALTQTVEKAEDTASSTLTDSPKNSDGPQTAKNVRNSSSEQFTESQGNTSSSKTSDNVIDVQDVFFSYGKHSSQRALDHINLNIQRGSSCAIVGQTGSGKSTLLRLLCALGVPDGGRILINGIDTSTKRGRRLIQGTIGYVMQRPERQLFAETVWDDVAFGPKNMHLSSAEIDRRCTEVLRLVGLEDKKCASPFELSGGQRRLCALAGVLAMEPTILVLDEPTAGLDPQGRRELRRLLARIHDSGTTLIQVTHAMEDAAHMEQLIVLDRSRVLMQGTPHQIFTKQQAKMLEEIGLGMPEALRWALNLKSKGLRNVGEPLTTSELVDAIVDATATAAGAAVAAHPAAWR